MAGAKMCASVGLPFPSAVSSHPDARVSSRCPMCIDSLARPLAGIVQICERAYPTGQGGRSIGQSWLASLRAAVLCASGGADVSPSSWSSLVPAVGGAAVGGSDLAVTARTWWKRRAVDLAAGGSSRRLRAACLSHCRTECITPSCASIAAAASSASCVAWSTAEYVRLGSMFQSPAACWTVHS